MQPEISVVIVTHNTRDLTLACLDSLRAEMDTTHGEVIVVDNASTDGSAASIRAALPAARIIENSSNLGFARGNNVGLAQATGRYLFCLNSDTEVQPGALRALIKFMDATPAAGACGPQLRNTDGSLQPSGRKLPSVASLFMDMTKAHRLWARDLYSEPGRDYNKIAKVGEISGAALLVRRRVYEQIGGFDERIFAYYEDVDWCKRIGDAGHDIYYVPDSKVMHHWRGTSRIVSERAYAAGQDSRRYYFAKHHGGLALAAVTAMLLAKECLLLLMAFLRRDAAARVLHVRMLINAARPMRTL